MRHFTNSIWRDSSSTEIVMQSAPIFVTSGRTGKKPLAPSVSKSVIVAANVDPSVIVRQHPTVVIVPIVGVPDSRDEAMEVPPMNTAVTDEGETVIAADMMRDKGGAARDTTAHQRIASYATVHKRLADNAATHEWIATNATVNKRVAAGHSAAGKARTSAEAVSAARGTAPEVTTTATTTMPPAASAMRSHRADGNCCHTKRSRCHQYNSELVQHDTFLPVTLAKPPMGFASLNPSYELVKEFGQPKVGRGVLSVAVAGGIRQATTSTPRPRFVHCFAVRLERSAATLDQLARLRIAPVRDSRLPDFFANAPIPVSTVEGSFATSWQGRPGASTAMWLSVPGARQPGMTPRFRVITPFFICFPHRKRGAALDAWRGVGGAPSIQRRSHMAVSGHFLGRPEVVNPTELHRFL
jgi:hypothetical protein